MKKKLIARIATATILTIGTSQFAFADTWVFRDASNPPGHERSMRAKMADGRKCGAVGGQFTDKRVPDMQQCMLAHGWVLDRVIPDPAPRHARAFHNPFGSSGPDDDLARRNEEASNNAAQQRDEEARSNEFQQQMQDQQNTDTMMQMLNNQ